MSSRAIPAVLLVPLLVVAIVVSSSACGTMANFNEGSSWLSPASSPGKPPTPYGGVQYDIELIADTHWQNKGLLAVPLSIIEVGLSAVGDTVTLLVVVWINAHRAWERAIYEQSGPHRVKVTEIEAVPNDAKSLDETRGRKPN